MAAAALARKPSSKSVAKVKKPATGETLVYLTKTLEILSLPSLVDIQLPPLDLSDWTRQAPTGQRPNVPSPDSHVSVQDERVVPAKTESTSATPISESVEPKALAIQPTPALESMPTSKKPDDEEEVPKRPKTEKIAVAPSKKRKSDSPDTTERQQKVAKNETVAVVAPALSVETHPSPSKSRGHKAEASDTFPQPLDLLFADDLVAAAELPEFFGREQLEDFSRRGRQIGRSAKHAGDKMHYAPNAAPHSGLLESGDCLLTYCFTFWCEDALSGRTDERGRLTKPGCQTANWESMFPMIAMVRLRAAKANWQMLVYLTHLLEAVILAHQAKQDRRMLHHAVEHQLQPSRLNIPQNQTDGDASTALQNDSHTPQSTGAAPTPPVINNAVEPLSVTTALKFREDFMRYSDRAEKQAAALSMARNLLDLSYLRANATNTARLCMTSQVTARHAVDCRKPWQFTFALETHDSYTVMFHLVNFGKALLEDIAKAHDVDFSPAEI